MKKIKSLIRQGHHVTSLRCMELEHNQSYSFMQYKEVVVLGITLSKLEHIVRKVFKGVTLLNVDQMFCERDAVILYTKNDEVKVHIKSQDDDSLKKPEENNLSRVGITSTHVAGQQTKYTKATHSST